MDSYHFWRGLLILIVALACILWVFWRALTKSDDPGRLIWKLAVTGVLLAILVYKVLPVIFGTGLGGAFLLPFAAAIGIMIGIIWASSWARMIFKPVFSLFDGGEPEGELTPQYSIAEARRAKGQFREAVTELRGQLEKFPSDLRLQLLLAEIHAENLNDLQAAEAIILRLSQQKHAPMNVANALQQVADWHLKYGQDPDSARQALQRIIDTYPNTPFAQTASQRIAHLASADQLLERYDRRAVKMKEYERDLGLRLSAGAIPKPAEKAETGPDRAAELVQHLAEHPMDVAAREELAALYANQYKHLPLAIEQLEFLLSQPQQKPRDIVRWLEMSADYHIKVGADIHGAEAALRRIMDTFPNSAFAETALRRLATLNTELNVHKKSQVVKLGSYEKDIGLKVRKVTDQPPAE